MNSAVAVELRGVTKDFASGLRGVKLRALDNVSLNIPRGEIFGLLGSNGSGKSTAIKTALGLIRPTAGETRVFGRSAENRDARRLIGYLPEAPDFYRYLTGRELVKFYGALCGLGGPDLRQRVTEVIALVNLTPAADRRVGTYSKGMLQRIGLAQALVHDPDLLILDEPTAGVDPIAAAEISDLILSLKTVGKTILVSSHLLAEIEDICDRVAILDRGRIILEGRIGDLLGGMAADVQAFPADALHPEEMAELEAWLRDRGASLTRTVAPRIRLEQVYRETVQAARGYGEAPR